MCTLPHCTETQEVQLWALAFRAGDSGLLSSNNCVYGKGGFRSTPSSLSATSRNNCRCDLDCRESSPGREDAIGEFATMEKICYNLL
jgi:hypothetical protein